MIDLGLFRTSCLNGLVVATSAGLSFRIPHIGDQREAVITAASKAMEYVPQLLEVVARWGERKLTEVEGREFALRGAKLKFPTQWDEKAPALLNARRGDDIGYSLWNVFNRVQENLMKGGGGYRTEKGRWRTTRPIAQVKKTLAVNRGLWELAEEFATK
jgi:hypothetical protein